MTERHQISETPAIHLSEFTNKEEYDSRLMLFRFFSFREIDDDGYDFRIKERCIDISLIPSDDRDFWDEYMEDLAYSSMSLDGVNVSVPVLKRPHI